MKNGLLSTMHPKNLYTASFLWLVYNALKNRKKLCNLKMPGRLKSTFLEIFQMEEYLFNIWNKRRRYEFRSFCSSIKNFLVVCRKLCRWSWRMKKLAKILIPHEHIIQMCYGTFFHFWSTLWFWLVVEDVINLIPKSV